MWQWGCLALPVVCGVVCLCKDVCLLVYVWVWCAYTSVMCMHNSMCNRVFTYLCVGADKGESKVCGCTSVFASDFLLPSFGFHKQAFFFSPLTMSIPPYSTPGKTLGLQLSSFPPWEQAERTGRWAAHQHLGARPQHPCTASLPGL